MLVTLCMGFTALAHAEIAVVDDLGQRIVLAAPARRIVSLAPHATELLFAAGAGERVVGAVQYSDYPPAAKAVPRVGGYSALDFEAILALKADLAVGWASGNNPESLQRLKQLGLPVFASQPSRLPDIPDVIERLAVLAGTTAAGTRAATDFRARLAALTSRYAERAHVTVFYQIWNRPMMTVSDAHLISDVMRACGGRNVFGELRLLAPTVNEEDVIRLDPQVIIASGLDEAKPEWLDAWKRWPKLTAVRRGNLYFIDPDLIQRPTPRVLDGMERMCALLDDARRKR